MIPYETLEKRWAQKSYRWCQYRLPHISDEGVALGANTVICKSSVKSGCLSLAIDGNEARILALLSVAHGVSLSPRIIKNYRNAARALERGEQCLAHIHLAHTGLQRLAVFGAEEEAMIKRLFFSEQLLDAGADAAEILEAFDLLPQGMSAAQWSRLAKAGFNSEEARDERGRWTDGGSIASGQPNNTNIVLASNVVAGTARKPGDVSAEVGQKIVDVAATWSNTPYAPGANGENKDKTGGGAERNVAGDCSGSVNSIMREAGVPYNYTSTRDFAAGVKSGALPFRELGADEAQPGDVVLYPGHMSVYAGGGNVWSARKPGKLFENHPVEYFGGTPRYFRPVIRVSA